MKKATLSLMIFSTITMHAHEEPNIMAALPNTAQDTPIRAIEEQPAAAPQEAEPMGKEEAIVTPQKQNSVTYSLPVTAPKGKPISDSTRNWIFAGSALVTAALGVVAVAKNYGHKAPNSNGQ
jgi:hypothetical protein